MENKGQISDGYHTFDELYEHRHALFMALQALTPSIAWKSRKHDDGSSLPGWFISGLVLPTGQITYHLPDKYWSASPAKELDVAPAWDGHTATDVISRLHDMTACIKIERESQ